tara:strand:- start:156 stop:362 length:207 start_codon:yes stop_codon:yes gene_type:complete
MSAQNRPVSKVSNKNFSDNFDRIFKKKEAPLKDRTKLGVSPSTEVINVICTQDKEYWEGFMAKDKEDE